MGLALLATLVAVAACSAAPPPVASQAQPAGAAITVTEGTLIVSNSGLDTEVKTGDGTYLSPGNRVGSGFNTEAALRLPDQSVLLLDPYATFQVVNWSQTEDITLRVLTGKLTLKAHSDNVTLEMSSVTSFGLNSLDFKVIPTSDGTILSIWLEDPTVRLEVEQGEATLSINDALYQAVAGTEVKASPGLEPDIVAAATPETTTTSSETAENSKPLAPTPAIVSSTETYLYPAPTLLEPEHQAEMKSGTAVSLIWEPVAKDSPDVWYEVQLWQATAAPYTVVGRIESTAWSPESGFQPGTFRWRIQVVRLSDGVYLSPPSETREFTLVQDNRSPDATPARPQLAQFPTPLPISGGAGVYPKPNLLAPANEVVFQADDMVALTWDSVGMLQDNQWYEVRLWENGTKWRGAVKTRSTSWQVPEDYNPGRYGWQLAVILVQDGRWVKDISPQSDMRFFVWNAPPSQGGDDHKDKSDSDGSKVQIE